MLNEPFSLVKLFVLGLLEQSDRYGYEIVATAELWAVHRWAGISIGSIYNALRKVTKSGLAEMVKVEREGNRPERQVYRITETGRQECVRMIGEGLASVEFEGREVDMALAFAHRIPPEVRRRKLSDRLAPISERLDQLEGFADAYKRSLETDDEELAEYRRLRNSAPWIYAGIRHGLARLHVEEQWTKDLLAEIDGWPCRPHDRNQTQLS